MKIAGNGGKMAKYVTFASRGDTIKFLTKLRGAGVPCQSAPTPVQRGDLCAVSVRVEDRYLRDVKRLLTALSLKSFRGIL